MAGLTIGLSISQGELTRCMGGEDAGHTTDSGTPGVHEQALPSLCAIPGRQGTNYVFDARMLTDPSVPLWAELVLPEFETGEKD